MAKFKPAKITSQGQLMMMQDLNNQIDLQFTRIAFGNGEYTEEEYSTISARTALKSQKQSFNINSMGILSKNSLLLGVVASNENLSEGYSMTEVGLFAKDGSDENSVEKLYAIVIADIKHVVHYKSENVYNENTGYYEPVSTDEIDYEEDVALPTFIFDNGASMKNKGYTFAINRLTEHLHRHYRKHGQDGYILIFDFSKFFDNVSHELVKKLISDKITDERVNKLAAHFIDMFGEKGLGLGSQISQVLALASANKLDHVIKEVYRIKGYARYMDDGYLISHSKGYLHACLRAIKAVCEELGIVLNKKKTQIVKLSHGFTWLKVRFFLTPTGKVIRKIYKRSVTKERQKLKKLRKKLNQGKMTYFDVWQSFQSWRAYAYTFNAYHTVQNMEKLFKDLFHKEIFNEVYGIAC